MKKGLSTYAKAMADKPTYALIFILLFLTLKNSVLSVEIRIKLKDLFKGEGITQIKTTRKILVLAFDDGPGEYTPQILLYNKRKIYRG